MYEYNEMIDRLKNLIDKRKISIKQLSESADVPYRTLYKIITKETKEPSVNIMIRVAKALNITTDNLIFGKDVKCNINLNHTEEKLLNDFRSLNEQGQEYIMQTIDMVKDKYSSRKSSNEERITVVAARGNSNVEIVSDDDAVRKDLENYIPPTDL